MLSIIGCGEKCTSHTDSDGNGICDSCGQSILPTENETPDGDLVFSSNGLSPYNFIVGEESNYEICGLIDETVLSVYEKSGVNLKRLPNRVDTAAEFEVLVGTVRTRGDEYVIDKHTLGLNGSCIKRINNKIIIQAGNDDLLYDMVELFLNDFLKLNSEQTDLKNITLSDDLWFTTVQSDYKMTDMLIDGKSIRDTSIYTDLNSTFATDAAYELQYAIYKECGIWLPIVNIPQTAPVGGIIIKKNEEVREIGGSRVSVSGQALIFESCFEALLTDMVNEFVSEHISGKEGELKVNGDFSVIENVLYLYYEDFGAVGDGITNDFSAIKATHDRANITGQTVVANNNKVYYIGRTYGKCVNVMTDVIFGSAVFIIDDSIIGPASSDRSQHIFVIKSEHSVKYIDYNDPIITAINERGGLKTTDTNIGFAPGYAAMVIPYNSTHKVYIRYGGNANSGKEQHEVVVVDKDGNIDPSTGILLDFEQLTSMTVYNIEDAPITVSGGIFKTKANCAPPVYTSYARGIRVSRSNVTIKNITHLITGEGSQGAPYGGFISMNNCTNLLVLDSTLTAHKTYREPSNNNIAMGTYDIAGSNFSGMYFKNCNQSNFFKSDGKTLQTGYWGIMGTNYGKNITYDNCTLSRLDAHAGVYNASVINGSRVATINLIGGGLARIEDSTVYNSSLVNLREDYGSTWKGDIIVKNVTQISSSSTQYLVNCRWSYHYFGYTTYLPQNIYVENLTLSKPDCNYYILYNYTGNARVNNKNISVGDIDFTQDKITFAGDKVERENLNPTVLTKKITLKNVNSAYKIKVSSDKWINSNVPLERIE